jgi:tRNA (guanine37-N1)-methyltransferase
VFSANIFTLYPDVFPGVLGHGLYERASKNNIWKLNVKNIRDYASDKHLTVDDKPFGGGSGMVLKADVINKCLDKNSNDYKTYYLSPRGKVFNQNLANQISNTKGINLLCGHFEGIDQRVLDYRKIEEISVGDFVLSGGESAAVIILDAVLRLIPGVLGNKNSVKDESFIEDLLEYPQYTQPRVWKNLEVPSVLLSGNHAEIKDWRLNQSQSITRILRPDLWSRYINNKDKKN